MFSRLSFPMDGRACFLSDEFVDAPCQWAHDAAQLQFKQDGADAVDGHVALYYQCVYMYSFLLFCQQFYDAAFLFA